MAKPIIMLAGDIIPRNAHMTPNALAIDYEGRQYSFAEHAERVFRLANALIDLEVKRQDRIAVLAQNCIEYLEVFGAGEVAGFIVATVNFRLAPREAAFVIGNTDPTVLFFEADFSGLVAEIRPHLPGVRHFVQIDGAPGTAAAPIDGCTPYEALVAAGAPDRPAMRPEIDDTAFLIHTSGTTGRPKGVMLGQRAQWNTPMMIGYDLNISPRVSWVLCMPLFHVGAKYLQLAHHMAGASVYLHRRFDAAPFADAIEAQRITTTHLAPTMLQAVMDLPDIDSRDLSSLHTVTYGAAPMPLAILRPALERFGPIFIQRYGATETAAVSALMKHQHVLEGDPKQVARLGSAGQPNLMTRLRIERDDGTECEVGEPGELLIANPDLVMQGYWRDPEATAATIKNGWCYSGDIATVDEEGYVFIIDRKKEMIISGGENIYPREVEDALLLHPDVADVAVIGVPDDKWGEAVLAFIVAKDGAPLIEDTLLDHCREMMASYKKPSRFEFRDVLPRMPSGKIDKVLLRGPFWQDRDRQV